jgi:alpha,alpha-trehalase
VSARRLTAALLLIACARGALPAPSAVVQSPQVLFGDLFVAVQSAGLFTDSKTFADATPNAAPRIILERFAHERPQDSAQLARFVARNFTLPAPPASSVTVPAAPTLPRHIDVLWPLLTRSTPSVAPFSSLLPLPRPYVVPGGRFREVYYWDSYFTMLGLVASGRRDLAQDMVRDFAALIDRYGHVPNGTRTYYLSRSQPPLFYAMVSLLEPGAEHQALARLLPELKAEDAFWMAGSERLTPGHAARRAVVLEGGVRLNRYWDDSDLPRDESWREDVTLARASGRPAQEVFRELRAAAESGWDFGSRWFADGRTRATIVTTEIVPVDLNSLLYGLERAIRDGCLEQGDSACAREYAQRASARCAALNRVLWDAGRGAYLDYRWTQRRRIQAVTAATLYPLFVGAASRQQAAAVADTVRAQLLRAGGLLTSTVSTGEQWDAPNGWAPLQWIAIEGLRRYGREALAATIACRWMANVENVYRASGKLVEKYNVLSPGQGGGGGEYPLQDGFGWTNGVLRRLLVMYPAYADQHEEAACPAP